MPTPQISMNDIKTFYNTSINNVIQYIQNNLPEDQNKINSLIILKQKQETYLIKPTFNIFNIHRSNYRIEIEFYNNLNHIITYIFSNNQFAILITKSTEKSSSKNLYHNLPINLQESINIIQEEIKQLDYITS